MSRLRWTVAILLVAALDVNAQRRLILAEEQEKTATQSIPNELPRSWSMDEIVEATPPYGVKNPVYVLAWKAVEDDREMRVESCLVLKVLDKDDEHGRWCLAHLYRHPNADKPEWRLSMIHVSGKPGTKYFPGL